MWFVRLAVVAALVGGCSSEQPPALIDNSALGGTISGKMVSAEDRLAAQDALIRRQEEEFHRQDLELQDLKRQEFYNQRVRKYEAR